MKTIKISSQLEECMKVRSRQVSTLDASILTKLPGYTEAAKINTITINIKIPMNTNITVLH